MRKIFREMTTQKLHPSVYHIQYELLLREAIERDSYTAVKLLLDFSEKYSIIPAADHFKPYINNADKDKKTSRGLIKAAQLGNYRLIRLFLLRNYRIEDPHSLACQCNSCKNDRLGQSEKRIEILKAITNPVYIGITSRDPFVRTFQLSRICSRYRSEEDSFEIVYNSIIDECQKFCFALLDNIENDDEVRCFMTRGKLSKTDEYYELRFIKTAMRFNQKEIVAHPISQHVISTLVSNGIPKWRTCSMSQRLVIITLMAFLYPITAIACIFFPCTYMAKIGKIPLIKFINGAASFVTMLVLLAIIATSEKCGLRKGDGPTLIETVLFIWIVSFFAQELSLLYRQGQREFFSSGWHWIDLCMIFFMIFSYFMWGIIYYTNPYHKDKSDKYFISSADGFFALSIILSSLRMVYLCQVTRFLGLLQICLFRMMQVIFQFAFISCVGLWSFSVGMAYLFHSSHQYHNVTAKFENESQHLKFTSIDRMLNGSFYSFPSTIVTLAWASMSMVDLKSLEPFKDDTMIHLWSYALFTVYFAVSMIVLINMLVAMMSNSYQQIEDNIEVEHKYARTNLWLEYIGDRNNLPCPFNVFPTYQRCLSYFSWLKKVLFCKKPFLDEIRGMQNRQSTLREDYLKLCKVLVERYMIQKFGMMYNDTSSKGNDEDDIFLSKVKSKIQIWTSVFKDTREEKIRKITTCFIDQARAGSGSLNSGYQSEENINEKGLNLALEDKNEPQNLSDVKFSFEDNPLTSKESRGVFAVTPEFEHHREGLQFNGITPASTPVTRKKQEFIMEQNVLAVTPEMHRREISQ